MADRAPDLLLLDGNSLAYRAFFALPESIATSAGEPTNAIFGFASMLVKLRQELGPIPTVVAWDAGLSGRSEMYAPYKAQRSKKPDLLREQWPHLAPMTEAFGFVNVSLEGYEADDVIGSIATAASRRDDGTFTVVVTGDRDMFQLIDDDARIAIQATARGITETKRYDRAAVVERYGLPPALIPDFYGLKGDTSDNIPGVPGIGDKTASQLLDRFGDLETVLASVDEISGAKRKENLTNHADDARVSRDLARIQTDLDLSGLLDLDEVLSGRGRIADPEGLREAFNRWELRDPWRRLEELLDGEDPEREALAPAAGTTQVDHREVGVGDLAAAMPTAEARVAIATHVPEPEEGQLFSTEETEGSGTSELPVRFGVARLNAEGAPVEVLIGRCADPADVVAALGDRPVVVHDAKALGTVPATVEHDTLLAGYLLEPQRRGYPLAELVDEAGIGIDLEDVAGAAAAGLALLAQGQREKLEEAGLTDLLHRVELPLVVVLREMERIGVRLSSERLGEVADEVRAEIGLLETEIHELAGREFTIGSPKQLGEVLFAELGLTTKRRGKTGFSTDARVLQQIRDEHEIVPRIERWRELSTLAKTYLEVLPALADRDPDGRIHTTFQQTVAQTGRLSSTDPNLQNVPVRTPLGRRIRGCFEAREGLVLLSCDYSQVELRILAHLAEEQVLRDVFREGGDVHTTTAAEIFGVAHDELDPGQRSKAKMVNYGIAYGLTDYGLAERLDIERKEAALVIDAYFSRFTGVKAFIDATIERAAEEGEVRTMFGRRRLIPELKARNPQVRSLGERLAVNTVIQGTAADIMKLAMIGAADALRDEGVQSRLVLSIHDELLVEGPEAEMERVRGIVEREMLAPWEHDPPLAVDGGVGRTWLDAK